MNHRVKSLQIRIFFWSVFSCIRTECGEENTGIYGPEKTPYLDIFHAVNANIIQAYFKLKTLHNLKYIKSLRRFESKFRWRMNMFLFFR